MVVQWAGDRATGTTRGRPKRIAAPKPGQRCKPESPSTLASTSSASPPFPREEGGTSDFNKIISLFKLSIVPFQRSLGR